MYTDNMHLSSNSLQSNYICGIFTFHLVKGVCAYVCVCACVYVWEGKGETKEHYPSYFKSIDLPNVRVTYKCLRNKELAHFEYN